MRRTHHVALTLGALAIVTIRFAAAEPMLFSAPVNLTEINTPFSDRNPTFSADGLELLFISDRPGSQDYDIWYASRTHAALPFGTPVNVSEINSPGREATPCLSSDGLTLYFARGWTGHTQSYDVYAAVRPDRSSAFSAPELVAEVQSPMSDGGPFISADGLALYLVYDADFPPPMEDLYVATRSAPGDPFSTPARIDELSTDNMERDPWVSADGLSMYFVSNRDGTHFGDYDIYLSERASVGQPFGEAVKVFGVSSVEHDGSPFYDENTGSLYFHSNGFGGEGDVDIWVSRVVPEPSSVVLMLSGFGAVVARRLRRRPKRGPH